jgi:stage III sporulation protein AH
MKKRARKNQVIITALAILIAVAGYLNYTERGVMKQAANTEETSKKQDAQMQLESVNADALKEYASDDLLTATGDILSLDGDGSENETTAVQEVAQNINENQTESSSDTGDLESQTQETESMSSEPGAAVLTSMSTFSANARLNREQVRAQNKETLLNALKVEGLSEEQKNHLTNEIVQLTEKAELENATETLLAAKGFGDAVVTISDAQVEVVVNATAVSDINRAQIEDVVKRKTGKVAQNIIITPITDEN